MSEYLDYLIPKEHKGCPCACHGGREVYHIAPCHNPLLTELPYKTVAPAPKPDAIQEGE